MTTLVEQLEQAADDADILARVVATMGHSAEVIGVVARAVNLRQRAAWVRDLLDAVDALDRAGKVGPGERYTLAAIAGPIPSETALAAPMPACTCFHSADRHHPDGCRGLSLGGATCGCQWPGNNRGAPAAQRETP